MPGTDVIHASGMKGGYTSGLTRDKAYETEGLLFARTRIKGGNVSEWHNHGKRDVHAYTVSGRIRFDTFDGKKASVEVGPGDFFHIPVGLVHRDKNLEPNEEAVMIVLFLGEGDLTVKVPEP